MSRWGIDGKPVDFAVEVKENSAIKAAPVTPSDATSLTNGITKGIYIGGSGDLAVTMADGSSATFTAISAGLIHPLSVSKVKATGTTATFIVAVY